MQDQGTLLRELAELERAQNNPRVVVVHCAEGDPGAVIHTVAGTRLEVPGGAARQSIFEALLPHEPELQRPSNAEPEFFADPRTAHGVWTELLLDLGASLHRMEELVPGLRVGAVRREGSIAAVRIHATGRHRTFSLDLASGQEPAGVSINWAFEFRDQSWPSAKP